MLFLHSFLPASVCELKEVVPYALKSLFPTIDLTLSIGKDRRSDTSTGVHCSTRARARPSKVRPLMRLREGPGAWGGQTGRAGASLGAGALEGPGRGHAMQFGRPHPEMRKVPRCPRRMRLGRAQTIRPFWLQKSARVAHSSTQETAHPGRAASKNGNRL